MTYKEFQIILLELDLSIKEIAQILGMNPNSITNYKLKGIIPLQLSILINLIKEMKKNNIDYINIVHESKKEFSKNIINNH